MGRSRKAAPSSSDRELRRLNEHLANYNLWVKLISEDGNCLFRSVADQLLGDVGRADEIRERAVAYMREHREDFEFFIDEDDGPFERYLDDMASDGTWGSQLELTAICKSYKIHMLVFQATTGDSYEMQWDSVDEDAFCVLLAYVGGEHYNSVRMGTSVSGLVDNQSLRRVRTEIYDSSKSLHLNDDKDESVRARVVADEHYKQFVELLGDCLPEEKAGEYLNNEAMLVDWFRRRVWMDLPLESSPSEEAKPSKATQRKKSENTKKKTGKKQADSKDKEAPAAPPQLVGPQLDEGLDGEQAREVLASRVDDALEAMLQRCMDSAN